MELYVWLGAFLVFNLVNGAKIKLDKLVPLCSKSDPNINDCVLKSSRIMVQHIADGIRDYGLYPFDPLKIQVLDLRHAEKAIGLKLNITDSVHTGVRRLQVKDFKVDVANQKYSYELFIPQYVITGICDIGGKILLLPITGHGFCNLTAYDMKIKIDMKLGTFERKGKQYYTLSDFKLKIVDAKGAFMLTGLFGGNKQLGDTMNRFLNENAQDVMNEMKGTLEVVWSDIFLSVVNRIFSNVASDELYKP